MKQTRLAHQAQTGFASAAAYDTHRPSYPREAVDKLLQALEIFGVKQARIADLAAGTGKFTELLAARAEGFDIVAIEPHDDMRQQLQRKNLKGVRVVKGSAEDLSGLADGSITALVAAQSFHWFANSQALKEIHRVLQPTGVFGVIWNIEDYNAPKSWTIHQGWETAMRDLTWTFEDDAPRFRHEKWREIFDKQNDSNPLAMNFSEILFSLPLGEGSVPFEEWLSIDSLWSRYRTLSQVAILEGDELEEVKTKLLDAVNTHDTPKDEQGRVAVHGQTFFAWTTRIPGEPLKSSG